VKRGVSIWLNAFRYLAVFLAIILLFFMVRRHVTVRELHLFCGSAVRLPMDEIIWKYEKSTGNRIDVTYGGSGSLLSQMELSRRGDLYISGSPDFIEVGEQKGVLVKGSAKPVAWLIPALIVPKGNPANVKSLEALARRDVIVGMGNPESVCMGLYGIEILQANNLLARVLPNVKVFAKSCEDVISLVIMGNVDVVIGWDSCVSWNRKELEMVKIPPDRIPRIAYVAAAIPVSAKDRKASEGFIAWLLSPASREVFKKWGYVTTEEEAKLLAPFSKTGGQYVLPDEYRKVMNHEK